MPKRIWAVQPTGKPIQVSRRVPWTRQPATPRINYNNPLCSGLTGLINGGPGLKGDIVNNTPVWKIDGSSIATPTGISIGQTSEGYSGLSWNRYDSTEVGPAAWRPSSAIFTSSVVFHLNGLAYTGLIFSTGTGGANGWSFSSRFNDGTVMFSISCSTSGNTLMYSSSGALKLNQLNVCTVRSDGSTLEVLINGVSAGTASISGNLLYDPNYSQITLGGTSTPFGYNGEAAAYHYAAIWNRRLSDQEIASQHKNPWQLFEPISKRNSIIYQTPGIAKFRKVSRVSQPADRAYVNTSNPLTQGLKFLSTGSSKDIDNASSEWPSFIAAPNASLRQFSPIGRIWHGDGSFANNSITTQYSTVGNILSTVGTGDFSVFFYIRIAFAETNILIGDSAGNTIFGTSSGSGGIFYSWVTSSYGPAITPGKYQKVLWTRKAGVQYIWADDQVTSVASSETISASGNSTLLCRANSNDYPTNGDLALVAIWPNRGFAPDEAKRLIENPWQLYDDLKSRYVLPTAPTIPVPAPVKVARRKSVPWKSQPQLVTEINRNNPITRDLVALEYPENTLGLTKLGGIIVNTRLGRAFNSNGGDNGFYRSIKGIGNTGTTSVTMMALVYGSAGITDRRAFTLASTDGSYYIFQIGSGATGNADTTSKMRIWFRNPSIDIDLGDSQNKVFEDGVPHLAVVKYTASITGGATISFWVDGKLDTTYSGFFTTGTTTGNFHVGINGLNRGSGMEYSSTTSILLGAVWYRDLSDSEIISLSANPWQLFQSLNRVSAVNDYKPPEPRVPKYKRTTYTSPVGHQSVIDYSTPISKDIKVAVVAASPVELVSREQFIWNNSLAVGVRKAVSSRGSILRLRNTESNDFMYILSNIFAISALPTNDCTVILHYNKIGINTPSGAFGTSGSRLGAHLPYSDGIVYWDYGGAIDGFSRLTYSGGASGDNIWAFTAGSHGMEIFKNGDMVASHVNSVSRSAVANHFFLGNHENAYADDAECAFLYVFARRLSANEIRSLTNNPWQVLQPVTRRYSSQKFEVSIYRPGSDVSTSGWTGSPDNVNLYTNINESTPSDSESIASSDIITPVSMGLDNPVPPGTYDISVRTKYSGTSGKLRIVLLDSSNSVLATSSRQVLTSSYTTYLFNVVLNSTATRFRIEIAA